MCAWVLSNAPVAFYLFSSLKEQSMIDENKLKEIVSYSCDTDGSKEAERWKEWFIRVIDAEVNREHEQGRH